MSDQRPLQSQMPNDATAIMQDLLDRMHPAICRAFDRIEALPGNKVERQNDALSMLGQVAAAATMTVVSRIMARKGVSFDVALSIATIDIGLRMKQVVDQAAEMSAATVQ